MRWIWINYVGCMNVCEYGLVMVIYLEGVWYCFEIEDDVLEIFWLYVGGGCYVDWLRLFIDLSIIYGQENIVGVFFCLVGMKSLKFM